MLSTMFAAAARSAPRLAARARNAGTLLRGTRSYNTMPVATGLFARNTWSAARLTGGAVAFSAVTYGMTQIQKPVWAEEAAPPPHGVPGTNKERSFIAIKPDGVQRGLISEIIKRFEAKGYKLVAMKMTHPTPEKAAGHYADLAGKKFFPSLVEYFSSGPIVCMVWEGHDVILGGRRVIGATNPDQSQPGSIRGDLCLSIGRNIIHGSDAPESAEHEINFWFTPEEVSNWKRAQETWIYE